MFHYEVTKDMTPAKIKKIAKQDLLDLFTEFLTEKFGEENVGMLLIGSGTSKKKELGFIFGDVTMDGESKPLVGTINPTTKEFYDHKSDKGKSYATFVFGDYRDAFEAYEAGQAEKAAIAAENKAKNTNKD